MELIARIRHRVGYVWYWRARHWWLDTRAGAVAQVACALVLFAALVLGAVRAVIVTRHPDPERPHEAIVWIAIELILLLVSSIIAAAMAPKPKAPAPAAGNTPTVQDGQSVRDHFGTVWEDDSNILAWKQMGTDPVKTKAGKK